MSTKSEALRAGDLLWFSKRPFGFCIVAGITASEAGEVIVYWSDAGLRSYTKKEWDGSTYSESEKCCVLAKCRS